jgi:hypothetical protein
MQMLGAKKDGSGASKEGNNYADPGDFGGGPIDDVPFWRKKGHVTKTLPKNSRVADSWSSACSFFVPALAANHARKIP